MDIQEMIELVKETKDFVENRERAGHIKTKGRADYVTHVDTDIQEFLFRELKACVPSAQRLGAVREYQGGKRIFLRSFP